MRRSCHRSSRPAAKGTPFPSLALIPGDVRQPLLVRTLGREVPVDEIGGSRRRLALVGTIPASLGHMRHEPFLRHDPADRLLRYAGLEHRLDPAVPVPALGIGERPGHLRPESGVLVNAEPDVVAVGGRWARCRASMSSSRANTPASTGRSTGSSPCSTGAAGRRRGLFLTTSATSLINAFPRFRFLDPAARRLRVIIIGCGRPATGVSGLIALRGVPVFGLQRGHAALAVRPDPAMHRADARAELFGGLLLLHAVRHRLDCPSPGPQWDDGFGHMAGIPGIHRRPTLQALPGRITQMLHHLGRRHRRGEIQLHRTLSFLKTGHTKIFPFGLQENVRSPLAICHGDMIRSHAHGDARGQRAEYGP
ncbi:conserved hypothetical protein [Bifidobacterium longum subsp. longum JDM301]|uniref:Uncharacterized protein n=1 Tax=Bifidobacterium longum subsp. longum (strain JDM301) TaxID=759350 RepID=D6ZWQ4_BIFLJ|nr:conserved hypothetical protein [Bifidobacterium longum subsp. longum JDM301]